MYNFLVQQRASNDNEKAEEIPVCIPTLERGNEGMVNPDCLTSSG